MKINEFLLRGDFRTKNWVKLGKPSQHNRGDIKLYLVFPTSGLGNGFYKEKGSGLSQTKPTFKKKSNLWGRGSGEVRLVSQLLPGFEFGSQPLALRVNSQKNEILG